jgi:hypothetical protein
VLRIAIIGPPVSRYHQNHKQILKHICTCRLNIQMIFCEINFKTNDSDINTTTFRGFLRHFQVKYKNYSYCLLSFNYNGPRVRARKQMIELRPANTRAN